jgi:hypothetical protein
LREIISRKDAKTQSEILNFQTSTTRRSKI